MTKITPITTVEELCRTRGAATGNVFVDGLVEFLKHSRSNLVEDAAAYLGVPIRLLSANILFFVGTHAGEVIVRYRSYQALDLLDNPELSKEEVAIRCGFASYKVLESVMRRYHGTTIEAYRTGRARRNGNFDYNQSAESRRSVIDKARQLRERDKTEQES